jgi:hypothetical protein
MEIPAILYTKYNEAMSLFLETANFGTPCKLVYQKISTLTSTPTPLRQRLTINGPQASQAGMLRGSEATKTVETTEDITLRVYGDKKSFDKIGAFDFIAGSCLTIGPLSLLDNIKKAHSIIINSDRDSSQRFERGGEPQIWGLNGEYCAAHWVKI